jgi:hypothetical protein
MLQKDVAAGMFLGLGLFKFHLVLPVVIMVALARRPRVLAGFLPTALLLVGISLAVSGTGVLYAYPAALLELNRTGGAGMVTAQSMTNLRGLLTAWVGRAAYPGPIHWLLLPVAIAAMLYTARLWRSSRQISRQTVALGLAYSLVLIVAILTSYYAYSYDLTVLLIPVLLLGGGFLEQSKLEVFTRRVIVSALLLLICSPLYWSLILRGDRPYLLVIPLFLLGIGIANTLRQLGGAREP